MDDYKSQIIPRSGESPLPPNFWSSSNRADSKRRTRRVISAPRKVFETNDGQGRRFHDSEISFRNRNAVDHHKSHWEHDDRAGGTSKINVGSGEICRVIFKNNRKRNARNLFKRLTLDDIDSDMVQAVSSLDDLSLTDKKESEVGGRRFKPRSLDTMRARFSKLKKDYAWYKVSVIRGAQFQKDELLQILVSVIPPTCLSTLKIEAYKYEKDGLDVTFYIGNYRTACDLERTSGRITDPEGEKLIVKVKETSPEVVLSSTDKEAIKAVCCTKRYIAMTKVLDLSKFHDDPDLRSVDIFVPLSKPTVLLDVIETLREVIPEIHGLDLSHNKLFTFPSSALNDLTNMKKLNLANNKIYHLSNFRNLKNLGIEELLLEGNPLGGLSEQQNQENFLKELRKIFPNLKQLDGVELQPVISFDTGTPSTLPRSVAVFYCDSTHKVLVDQFILEYFQIYDSDNRAQLMEAYDSNAQFSLSCNLPRHTDNEKNLLYSNGNVEDYLRLSRNLCKIKPPHQRKQKLFVGKERIVQCLCSIPSTHHDQSSFTTDLTISAPSLVSLTITGIFRERPSNSVPVIRSFARMFVVVSFNGRCSIINELMFIGRPTVAQAKMAFKSQPVAGPSTALALPTTSAVVPSVGNLQELDIETKKRMVMQLAAQTGMNLVYSDKCLCETGWNYEAAVLAFNTHKANLPAEAFVK